MIAWLKYIVNRFIKTSYTVVIISKSGFSQKMDASLHSQPKIDTGIPVNSPLKFPQPNQGEQITR